MEDIINLSWIPIGWTLRKLSQSQISVTRKELQHLTWTCELRQVGTHTTYTSTGHTAQQAFLRCVKRVKREI